MSETLDISGKTESGVPVITLTYGPEGMLRLSGNTLANRLAGEYERLAEHTENPSLVVDIKAETAGSPLIRALVNLYKLVTARKGQLICAGYPLDFVPALTALGVTSLPGFRLVSGDARNAAASFAR